jgi:hypothetical protein
MKPSLARNLYEILELEKTASREEIDNAFRKQAFLWHPDKHIDDDDGEADAEFKILMNAYCILSDPERKQNYDRFHFKQTIQPNYGKFRDERLHAYRARQRKILNHQLKKNERSYRLLRKMKWFSLMLMAASVAWFAYLVVYPMQTLGDEHVFVQFMPCLPLVALNAGMICFLVTRKEILDNRKRLRSLAIKLYAHVDE